MFYDKVVIRGDNDIQFEIQCAYPEKKSDSSGDGVTEWSDNYIDATKEELLIKINQAKNITIRFDGQSQRLTCEIQ